MSRSKGGVKYFPQRLERAVQQALLADLRRIIAEAPLFTPTMPRSGKPMSVRMTNCGPLGWVPGTLLDLWKEVGGYAAPPEACLVNYYAGAAKMGLHQDKDEEDFSAPVLSVSLGDTGIFRVGGRSRKDPTERFELKSGDVVVLCREDRLAYHGIDRVLLGTSDLLTEGGRFNLTLRRVTRPE